MIDQPNDTAGGVLKTPDLPFKLTGSQAKTAYSLRKNCETMIAGENPEIVLRPARQDGEKFIPAHWVCTNPKNLNATGFLTLTLGDWHCAKHWIQTPNQGDEDCCCPLCGSKMKFVQIFDSAESSRRINNLNRRILKKLFSRGVVVTERHKNKAIHFHIVGVLKNRVDIRTGFNFKALDAANQARAEKWVNKGAEIAYKMAASPELLRLWKMLRETLPGYGFGRAELTPIKSTGEAVAAYVSKYIEKNICNRIAADKHKKLVRYIGDWKTLKKLDDGGIITIGKPDAPDKLKPNDFGWASKRSTAWRGKARETANLIGCQNPEDCKDALGARWAFYLSTTWQGRTKDDLSPFLIADWETKRLLANDLANISRKVSPGWLKKFEEPFERYAPGESPEFGFIGRVKWELDKDAPDAEFTQIFKTGWKAWENQEKERLEKIAADYANN